MLFLVAAMIEQDQGTSKLARIGGLAGRRAGLAALFALAALSLAGLPPFSGFVAKLALLGAGLDAGAAALVVTALAGSLLTLLSMTKIWLGVFWGPPTLPARPAEGGRPRLMGSAATATVGATLVIAIAAGPLWSMSERAAAELLNRTPYTAEVLR